jgi:hypothetical protein
VSGMYVIQGKCLYVRRRMLYPTSIYSRKDFGISIPPVRSQGGSLLTINRGLKLDTSNLRKNIRDVNVHSCHSCHIVNSYDDATNVFSQVVHGKVIRGF